MRSPAKLLLAVLMFISAWSTAAAAVHPVPKGRAALHTPSDWFPYVFSKIAPLEWWSFAASPADVRREDYPEEYLYNNAKTNTVFPRFCFSLFRPKPELVPALSEAVHEYQGGVIWYLDDECVFALPTNWTAYHGPRADAEFVRRAIADIPQFCSFLENRLALENRPAVDFDAHWLTREGLAASKGQFEDYWEPGDWQVMLSPKPQESPSSDDVELKIGISMSAHDELFDELGADWAQYHADWEEHHRTWMAAHDGLSDESAGEDTGWQPHRPLLPAYPLLSRLSEIGTSAVYEPREVNALLAEFFRAQAAAQGPAAIRGLDNLIRIARRAQKLKLGIYFGGRWE